MIVVKEIDPDITDIRRFIIQFGDGVRASGEDVPAQWAEERINAIKNRQEYCYAAVDADRLLGITVFSQKEGRGFAFVSWEKEEVDREGLLLLVREYVTRLSTSSWLRISGIHPNIPEETMTSVCESLGFQKKKRIEMHRSLSDIPDAAEPEGAFAFVPITDFAESVLSKLDWESYRNTPDEGLFASSPEENEKMIHSLLTGDYGPVIKNASVCAVNDGNPIAMIAVTDMGDKAFLADLSVSQNYRRRGLAQFLITRAMKEAAQLRKKEMTLWVSEENLGAFALYKRLGFTELRSGTYYVRKSVAETGVK
jgi:ribosomal protein S18 acetylase RimI-like enzyme